jgi:hypothetical protein
LKLRLPELHVIHVVVGEPTGVSEEDTKLLPLPRQGLDEHTAGARAGRRPSDIGTMTRKRARPIAREVLETTLAERAVDAHLGTVEEHHIIVRRISRSSLPSIVVAGRIFQT